MTTSPENDRIFMDAAIRELKISPSAIKVGAVLVIDGRIVAAAHKDASGHAERNVISKAIAEGVNLRQATLYTTLEPCVPTRPNQQKQCCSELIASSGIPEVVIGCYDPHSIIYRKGWRVLRNARVRLRDFPADLRAEIDSLNKKFIERFACGVGPTGGAKLYHEHGATFEVQLSAEDSRTMNIEWKVCGHNAAYAFASPPCTVAHAVYVEKFSEIDDPTIFRFSQEARIGVGQVGIFEGPDAFVFVRVKEALSGPEYKSEHFHVIFDYEVRIK